MLNPKRNHSRKKSTVNIEYQTSAEHKQSNQDSVPRIAIHPPSDQELAQDSDSSTESEEMPPSSSSNHSNAKKSSSSRSKKDDWSKITDPEDRRRVQNKLAQRKFRDKAKEARERSAREADNLAHAHQAYTPPQPAELVSSAIESGIPWGSFSFPYVISRGQAATSGSRSHYYSHSQAHSNEHSNEQSQYSPDGRSPFEGLIETFDEQELEGSHEQHGVWVDEASHSQGQPQYQHYTGEGSYQDAPDYGGYPSPYYGSTI